MLTPRMQIRVIPGCLPFAVIMLCLSGALQGQSAAANKAQVVTSGGQKVNTPDGFQFSDTPGFAIAGVTDWTAVGGHGSDATLRTSEDLNRETLALAATRKKDSAVADAVEEARLKHAVVTAPEAYEANRALGMYYLETSRYTEALPPLTTAMKVHPGNAEDTYYLAVAYRGSGDARQALELVQNALKRGETADLHSLAGELDEVLGDPLNAVREEERAVRLDPSEQNYLTWGSELLLHRAIWQAAEVFSTGVKAYPSSARLEAAWGAALFSEAKYEDAAQHLCRASTLNPADREPYVLLGKAAIASPLPLPCAEARLEQFARSRPDDAEANYYLAMVLQKGSSAPQPERVEALLQRSVTLDPKYAAAYLQLGVLASSRKNDPEAISFFTKAAEADPQLGEAHYRLGVIYSRAGDKARATREFELHEQADAANAAKVEQQRREVKQFLVTSAGQMGGAAR